jgi:hypothetical protein
VTADWMSRASLSPCRYRSTRSTATVQPTGSSTRSASSASATRLVASSDIPGTHTFRYPAGSAAPRGLHVQNLDTLLARIRRAATAAVVVACAACGAGSSQGSTGTVPGPSDTEASSTTTVDPLFSLDPGWEPRTCEEMRAEFVTDAVQLDYELAMEYVQRWEPLCGERCGLMVEDDDTAAVEARPC